MALQLAPCRPGPEFGTHASRYHLIGSRPDCSTARCSSTIGQHRVLQSSRVGGRVHKSEWLANGGAPAGSLWLSPKAGLRRRSVRTAVKASAEALDTAVPAAAERTEEGESTPGAAAGAPRAAGASATAARGERGAGRQGRGRNRRGKEGEAAGAGKAVVPDTKAVPGIRAGRGEESSGVQELMGAAAIGAASSEGNLDAKTESLRVKESRRKADWQRARAMWGHGGIHRGVVEAANNGGLLVRFGDLQAFIPYSQLDTSRFLSEEGTEAVNSVSVGRDLVGQTVAAQVTDVAEDKGRLILSEKQALASRRLREVEEGQVLSGRVASVTDFGAFVDLRFPDGTYPLKGLVHVSELSWDVIRSPRDVVWPGDDVTVKVIGVDREKRRVALSLKQLQADPLLETLDTLMPAGPAGGGRVAGEPSEGEAEDSELLTAPLPGLGNICEELLREEGITAVTLGRQAVEKRVVSQDLELWLSNAPSEGGLFTLLARAGRQVQEVHVTSSLEREGMKLAVQRVTGRVA